MKICELCGAENGDDALTCMRCGFEFPKEIRSDVRDPAILKKHKGKSVEEVKKELKNRHVQLRSYLENIDARDLTKEDLVSLLDESLAFLHVPAVMGVEDELRFSQEEMEFINLMSETVDKMDLRNGGPSATSSTYIKLANALISLDRPEQAMRMMEKALLINPNNQDAQYGKAKLLFYIKEYSASKRILEKMVKKDHSPAGILLELIIQIESQ